jgi:hypothetical protein
VRVHLAVEHALELEATHAPFEPRRFALDVLRGALVVLALGEIEQLRGIGNGVRGAIDLRELRGELRAFAPELLRLVRLLPDGRVLELATDLL